jgi:hypothetical protein
VDHPLSHRSSAAASDLKRNEIRKKGKARNSVFERTISQKVQFRGVGYKPQTILAAGAYQLESRSGI